MRAYVLNFKGNYDYHLPLIEFAYSNSYHFTIGMAAFEALYGHKYTSFSCWDNFDESKLIGQELVQQITEKLYCFEEKKTNQTRQKTYIDNGM